MSVKITPEIPVTLVGLLRGLNTFWQYFIHLISIFCVWSISIYLFLEREAVFSPGT